MKIIWLKILLWHYETEQSAGVYMDYMRGLLDKDGAIWTIKYLQEKIDKVKQKLHNK